MSGEADRHDESEEVSEVSTGDSGLNQATLSMAMDAEYAQVMQT